MVNFPSRAVTIPIARVFSSGTLVSGAAAVAAKIVGAMEAANGMIYELSNSAVLQISLSAGLTAALLSIVDQMAFNNNTNTASLATDVTERSVLGAFDSKSIEGMIETKDLDAIDLLVKDLVSTSNNIELERVRELLNQIPEATELDPLSQKHFYNGISEILNVSTQADPSLSKSDVEGKIKNALQNFKIGLARNLLLKWEEMPKDPSLAQVDDDFKKTTIEHLNRNIDLLKDTIADKDRSEDDRRAAVDDLVSLIIDPGKRKAALNSFHARIANDEIGKQGEEGHDPTMMLELSDVEEILWGEELENIDDETKTLLLMDYSDLLDDTVDPKPPARPDEQLLLPGQPGPHSAGPQTMLGVGGPEAALPYAGPNQAPMTLDGDILTGLPSGGVVDDPTVVVDAQPLQGGLSDQGAPQPQVQDMGTMTIDNILAEIASRETTRWEAQGLYQDIQFIETVFDVLVDPSVGGVTITAGHKTDAYNFLRNVVNFYDNNPTTNQQMNFLLSQIRPSIGG